MKEVVEELAEVLRQETFHWLLNNCLTKSIRLKRQCLERGIKTKVVLCFGYARTNKWFNHWLIVPAIHVWCDVKGKRVEVARPLNEKGLLGVPPGEIKPLVGIWF
ncbi:hypothetical protein ES703_118163 [subsurface metagenome]